MTPASNASRTFAMLLVAFASICAVAAAAAQSRLPLHGQWQFAIDSLDRGIAERWYARTLHDAVMLPGSMASNKKGSPVTLSTKWTGDILDSSFFTSPRYEKYRHPGNIKVPFWLQPVVSYCGAAWYRKEIRLPAAWKDKCLELFLERCHWQSMVWIDTTYIGMQNGLSAPHRFDIPTGLSPGTHVVTVRVDNRIHDIDPGVNSSSLTDNSQTNWNGIVGAMELRAQDPVHIAALELFPDIHRKTVRIVMSIANRTGRDALVTVSTQAVPVTPHAPPRAVKKVSMRLRVPLNDTTIVYEYAMGKHASLWDEFTPSLYAMTCVVSNARYRDRRNVRFGLRQLGTRQTQFTVNDSLTFLRGTLECAIFPRTGFPPTDIVEWTRIFNVCRQYGLNHVRFHSWCPPEAAFAAADRLGMYLYVECSSWANPGTSVGDGKPIDHYILDESRRIVDAYGNHPSFCFLSYGNEPLGVNLKEFLTGFVRSWKARDNRRLYTGAAGWPVSDESEFHVSYKPRIQHWAEGLKSIINSQPPNTMFDWQSYIDQYKVPVVSHEIGEWCAYPEFGQIKKYDGVLQPKNFEIFQESLADSGMGGLAKRFLDASGALQVLCYKADIEAAFRTKGMGGFELLDLHDFPGQGSGLVGVLDAFWESKGYVTPEAYRAFCNTTVPLARIPKVVYTDAEVFTASVSIAHFGSRPLAGIVPSWSITRANGAVVASGKFANTTIPIGNDCELGSIRQALNGMPAPAMYTLEVRVGDSRNRWNFWVYPSGTADPFAGTAIRMVQKMDDATLQFLENGGAVLFTPVKGSIANENGGDVAVGFSSIFWNTAWTAKQAPHTLGILCDPAHPLFNKFPTQPHSNYQWWDAMSHASALHLSRLGRNIQPIVRIIDDWHMNRPLGLIVEANVGKGRIILSGIDLVSDAGHRLEARQLTASIVAYMQSAAFHPSQEIDVQTVKDLCQ